MLCERNTYFLHLFVSFTQSSLLHLLLGELPITSGQLSNGPNGTISYASQEPWLFTGTVRNNILFGQPYDPDQYNEVSFDQRI